MDVNRALNIAMVMETRRLDQARMESVLQTQKKYQEFQVSVATQLLASLPGVNPDGVGETVDITA
ncbi:hypothetical protein IIA79_04465 [bacterium]|nr:hypothetical protein [bacterium]